MNKIKSRNITVIINQKRVAKKNITKMLLLLTSK